MPKISLRASAHRSRCSPERGKQSSITCFVCGREIIGTAEFLNQHVDKCLEESDPQRAAAEQVEQIEWNGVTRIRPSTLYPCRKVDRVRELDVPDDLNIAEDDANIYGEPQYSESSLPPSIAVDSFYPTSTSARERSSDSHTSGTDPAIIIECLREKIKSQEAALINQHKCLVCMDSYRRSVTSIVCWHVYCEECWLQALSAKKLCPQCAIITSPSDLRRIYL